MCCVCVCLLFYLHWEVVLRNKWSTSLIIIQYNTYVRILLFVCKDQNAQVAMVAILHTFPLDNLLLTVKVHIRTYIRMYVYSTYTTWMYAHVRNKVAMFRPWGVPYALSVLSWLGVTPSTLTLVHPVLWGRRGSWRWRWSTCLGLPPPSTPTWYTFPLPRPQHLQTNPGQVRAAHTDLYSIHTGP